MAEQPTLNKFRKALNIGSDLASIVMPTPIKLTVSGKGITDREAEKRIQELQNIENEWNVIAKEANVHEAKEKAHEATYKAVTAGIGAATAFIESKEAFWKHETAQVNEAIAHAERDVKVASLPVEQAKFNAELQSVVLQLEDLELELKKLGEDVEHTKVMNSLNGYSVEIQIPKITIPKFDTLKLGASGQNGQQ